MKKVFMAVLSLALFFVMSCKNDIFVQDEISVSDSREVYAPVNLAASAKAYASTTESDLYKAEFANDGDMTTRWSSEFKDGQYIIFDLGSVKPVATVSIDWEDAYAREYSVYVSSNGKDFRLKSTMGTNARGNTVNLIRDYARYVKIACNKRATTYGISIYEVKIWEDTSLAAVYGPYDGDPAGEDMFPPESNKDDANGNTIAPEAGDKLVPNSNGLYYKETSGINIVNVQSPAFAKEAGIYMTVEKPITQVSVNGDSSYFYDNCAIQGAGAVVYLSSLIQADNRIVIVCGNESKEIFIKNTKVVF